ncbi:YqkE family protein [Peribacillus tepidiphilus]|jgi:hypothetical protein|uniref:YqkE family protein n=1 Tax=Peribacillus tepidiphilus TaxID=2652445 RepID=UPI001292342F|nr:YqkE family protein [Peribacillus tepidiphilus]
MKKKGKKNPTQTPKKEEKLTLGDMLNQELLTQLREKQQELTKVELLKKEEEERRRKEELKKKEKNKTFEELLNESEMDWRSYKD